MADNAEKGPDTLRPAKGDDAADLYSSSTVVRDAPSELVELMKETQARAEVKVPSAAPLPADLTSTKPPPPKPEPPKLEGPGRRLDELWDALPSASGDDDDDDGDGDMGSARLHAAEDVTRMLAIPDDLQMPEVKKALSAQEAKRVAEAQPSIVVADGVPSQAVSSRPRPPPKVESEDEIMETSPRKLIPSGLAANRRLWIASLVAASVILAVVAYFTR